MFTLMNITSYISVSLKPNFQWIQPQVLSLRWTKFLFSCVASKDNSEKNVKNTANTNNNNNTDQSTHMFEHENTTSDSALVNEESSALDQLIINSVRTKPALWEHASKKSTPASTWNLWETVCGEVEVPRSKRDDIKQRWTSLRNRYMKAHNTFLKHKISGKAANAKNRKVGNNFAGSKYPIKEDETRYKSGFLHYNEMSFLSDTVEVPK